MIPNLTSYPIAFTTSSASVVSKSIFFCVFMSVYAVSLSGLLGHKTIASHDVFPMRNCFQMIWIHTKLTSTKMINLMLFWNSSFRDFVAHLISFLNFIFCSGNVEHSIPFAVRASRPHPTRFGLFDLAPEIFHRAKDNAVILRGQS